MHPSFHVKEEHYLRVVIFYSVPKFSSVAVFRRELSEFSSANDCEIQVQGRDAAAATVHAVLSWASIQNSSHYSKWDSHRENASQWHSQVSRWRVNEDKRQKFSFDF